MEIHHGKFIQYLCLTRLAPLWAGNIPLFLLLKRLRAKHQAPSSVIDIFEQKPIWLTTRYSVDNCLIVLYEQERCLRFKNCGLMTLFCTIRKDKQDFNIFSMIFQQFLLNKMPMTITCDFSMVALYLSHIGDISSPAILSLSPCWKNSSIILSHHCLYRSRGFVGLDKSAQ